MWNKLNFKVVLALAVFGAFLGFAMPWRRLSRRWPSIAAKSIRTRIAEF